MLSDSDPLTIAAVLTQSERQRVDAAGNGLFSLLHRDSLRDALRVVRERPVDAVLLSVHRCTPDHADELRQLVHQFPGVATVALVSGAEPAPAEALLRLGASGVRQVVDVSSPTGWSQLRQVVAQPASRAVARIQGAILGELPDAPSDARLFLETMIRLAPRTVTVRQLAAVLKVCPSTLMSRFQRAVLPSPKNYLAAIRLLHAAWLFETRGFSVADVAYRLEYSSPQSFGRHLRTMLGFTSSEFRSRFPFPVATERFLDLMIRPYVAKWSEFHPLEGARRRLDG
jgi:AraC-like DNA-binding protein